MMTSAPPTVNASAPRVAPFTNPRRPMFTIVVSSRSYFICCCEGYKTRAVLLGSPDLESRDQVENSVREPAARQKSTSQKSNRLFVIGHRRCDHQKHQIDQAGIRNGVFDTGRQKDEIVLAHHMILACNLHQPLAFEHVVDLLLNQMLVPGDMRHRLIHRNP